MADQTFWTKPEEIRIFQRMIDMEDGTHAIRMEAYPPKDFSTIDLTGANRLNVDLPYKKELQAPLVATDIGIITHSVIQGFSTGQGGGFHDVKVTPSGALTVDATIQEPLTTLDSTDIEYIPVATTITASGDNTIHTPAIGKRVRLHWIYAINDPLALNSTKITVKIGTTVYYVAWAISKRQQFTGGINEPLIINLSAMGNVAVTAFIQEI